MLSREAEEFVRAGGPSDLVQDAAGLGRSWRALVRIIRKRVNRSARSARSAATTLRTELDQDDRRVAEAIAGRERRSRGRSAGRPRRESRHIVKPGASLVASMKQHLAKRRFPCVPLLFSRGCRCSIKARLRAGRQWLGGPRRSSSLARQAEEMGA
jgi:hypothetical protein